MHHQLSEHYIHRSARMYGYLGDDVREVALELGAVAALDRGEAALLARAGAMLAGFGDLPVPGEQCNPLRATEAYGLGCAGCAGVPCTGECNLSN